PIADPVIPGAGDAGGTEIPFLNPARVGITYGVDFLGADGRHLALPPGQQVGPLAARTETLTATGPGAVPLLPAGAEPVAAARRAPARSGWCRPARSPWRRRAGRWASAATRAARPRFRPRPPGC